MKDVIIEKFMATFLILCITGMFPYGFPFTFFLLVYLFVFNNTGKFL